MSADVPAINLPLADRQTSPLSLRDALALALQNSDTVRVTDGGQVRLSSATGFDPLIAEELFRAEEARFDSVLSAGYSGSQISEPPDSFFGPGLFTQTRRDEGTLTASLSKTWSPGTSTSVSYLPPLGYLFVPDHRGSGFNPAYSADLVFEARQPLLRGGGRTVNTAPIQVAGLRQQQSECELRLALLAQVRSVEEGYWNLQAAWARLQALDLVLPLLHEAVRIQEQRFQVELITQAEVARSRLQLDQYRQRRIDAENEIQGRENAMRNLLGLPVFDGQALLPMDPPRQIPPQHDLTSACATALAQRPDLIRQRLQLQVRELELLVKQNALKPQLDLRARYRASGLDEQLDDAIRQLRSFDYTSWTLGVNLEVPLGNRAARAGERAAQLQVARDLALLRQTETNLIHQLTDLTRDIDAVWRQYEISQQRIEDSRKLVEVARTRFSAPPPANAGQDWLLATLNDYQSALREHVDAHSDAAEQLARYNILLSRLDEAQGTILETRQVYLAEAQSLPVVPSPFGSYRAQPGVLPPMPPSTNGNAQTFPFIEGQKP